MTKLQNQQNKYSRLQKRTKYSSVRSYFHALPSSEKSDFSNETMKAVCELGDVLKQIHDRMVLEGYEMIDGKIVKKSDTI